MKDKQVTTFPGFITHFKCKIYLKKINLCAFAISYMQTGSQQKKHIQSEGKT